jgi:hypothetical protein
MHRRFVLLFACVILTGLIGCGSSGEDSSPAPAVDGGATTDAANEVGKDASSTDAGTSKDTGSAVDAGAADVGTAGVKCGSEVCPDGQVCCVSGDADAGFGFKCATSCSGGAALACDGPEDCKSGTPICCATVNVTGMLPACDFKSGAAECKTSCDSNIPLSCPSTAIVRPCHKPSDCPEPGYANCCEFESGGTSATFCANDTLKFLAIGCL